MTKLQRRYEEKLIASRVAHYAQVALNTLKAKVASVSTTIDTLGVTLQATKSFGHSVSAQRNKLTSAYQWLVADHVYNTDSLTAILSHWLEKSELVGEAKRTVKDALQNAINQWGEGNVTCEINERTTKTKKAGIHIHNHLTLEATTKQLEADRIRRHNEAYQASVKALTKAFKDHGHALYDVLATLEMERQEVKAPTTEKSDVEKVKTAYEQQAETVEAKVNAAKAKMFAEMMA